LLDDGSIDDESVTDNKDLDKILATVINIVYRFTSLYPGKFVFFRGSTPARRRLFRIVLNIYLEELKKHFHIYGVLQSGNNYVRMNFDGKENYFGFIVRKKIIFST
jgi:hypothetical protein